MAVKENLVPATAGELPSSYVADAEVGSACQPPSGRWRDAATAVPSTSRGAVRR